MNITVQSTAPGAVAAMRTQFLQELNRQFVLDKCYRYGWADAYAFLLDGTAVGYGAVWGSITRQRRDAVFEFYLQPPYRRYAHEVFGTLHALCGATYIEAQSNDALLFSLLCTHTRNIQPEAILFEDRETTALSIPGAALQPVNAGEESDDSQYRLVHNGQTVATGGLMLNYNPPYADIYMEVNEGFRGNGYGSFIVQALKSEAYRMGRVPSARCNVQNRISQNTLQRAGFAITGYRVKGEIV